MYSSRKAFQSTESHILEPRDGTGKSRAHLLPSPSFRHAAPSAPWPWVDIDDNINNDQMNLMNGGAPPIPELCDHGAACNNCWRGYPESRFPNWTRAQVKKSRIADAVARVQETDCICHHVDVDVDGIFRNAEGFIAMPGQAESTWKDILRIERPSWSRTRAVFIENLSGPMLQMLGTRYNIEPFFFSSSLNWIPSRFQEDMQPGIGDHITITLTFLRSVSTQKMPDYKAATRPYSGDMNSSSESVSSIKNGKVPQSTLFEESIDTKAPLKLRYNDRYLCLDLLSVHLIRNIDGNTIISYHPSLNLPTTAAEELHDRIRFAGQSVYWQKMFQESSDPTLLLLTYLWHALYAWDQSLEHLYHHICQLESKVIDTGRWKITQDLHVIRAHQLFYASLLGDFKKSVEFIRKHQNPAMSSDRIDKHDREISKMFLERECDNLVQEIDRLTKDLLMQESRLKNVMNLVFCSVNISDSRLMRDMTSAAMRDSSAMKQIAYLTMIFLPASFVAGLFGMNTREIVPGTNGDLRYYVALALPLTIFTIWVIIAFQSQYLLKNKSFFARLGWPWFLLHAWWTGRRNRQERAHQVVDRTIKEDYDHEIEYKGSDSFV
ncbi:hypothetical protein P691DRAFT_735815 [Macrolepiota fuliginosa MF-IS2]|uniref:Uncharacterized protein n=1 Tax=Macrolepiota fuliginosa MF-IS2 TaxID=1400762 RepID=A0A9P6C0S0_9AGAR|nr:hypothetical protein P691DRAFT_735815 [Macrolepiota fuliginosa MF-IS2]